MLCDFIKDVTSDCFRRSSQTAIEAYSGSITHLVFPWCRSDNTILGFYFCVSSLRDATQSAILLRQVVCLSVCPWHWGIVIT